MVSYSDPALISQRARDSLVRRMVRPGMACRSVTKQEERGRFMAPNYFDFTLELTLNPSLFFVISGVSTTVVAVDDPKAYWAPKT